MKKLIRSSKPKTKKLAISACAIFLVSCSSCKSFKWEPKPWLGDHETQVLFTDTEEIKCSHPDFSLMTCFDPKNIADLKTAIQEVNGIKEKDKKKILRKIDKAISNPL